MIRTKARRSTTRPGKEWAQPSSSWYIASGGTYLETKVRGNQQVGGLEVAVRDAMLIVHVSAQQGPATSP